MKAPPRIKVVTVGSSSAMAAAQQHAQGSVIIRTGAGTDISNGRTGLMKRERTNFSSPTGLPNLDTLRSSKGTSHYPKGKKRFG